MPACEGVPIQYGRGLGGILSGEIPSRHRSKTCSRCLERRLSRKLNEKSDEKSDEKTGWRDYPFYDSVHNDSSSRNKTYTF